MQIYNRIYMVMRYRNQQRGGAVLWVILSINALVFLLAGIFLIPFYQANPDFRASIVLGKDLFVAVLTISGIAVAAENMRRAAITARTSTGLRFIERWNDPKLADDRKAWHTLYDKLKEMNPAAVHQLIASNEAARTLLTDFLNFFEEISHAVNTGAADDDLVQRVLGQTIQEYYNAALPWIQHRQADRPDAWVEIGQMLTRWRMKN